MKKVSNTANNDIDLTQLSTALMHLSNDLTHLSNDLQWSPASAFLYPIRPSSLHQTTLMELVQVCCAICLDPQEVV